MRNPHQREMFIAGLCELADYLMSHPEVPVPDEWTSTSFTIHFDGTDAEQRAQVEYVAQLLETPIIDRKNGQISTRRSFGPITYGAVAISREYMRRYRAAQSYADSVIPDTTPAVH